MGSLGFAGCGDSGLATGLDRAAHRQLDRLKARFLCGDRAGAGTVVRRTCRVVQQMQDRWQRRLRRLAIRIAVAAREISFDQDERFLCG
jgi:hypothetical protein